MPLLVSWGDGHSMAMHDRFTVGSDRADPAPDIGIADEYLSSPHVRFWPQGGRWLVEDLGSTNGTYINGGFKREQGPCALRKGDTVRIGRTVLTVVPF